MAFQLTLGTCLPGFYSLKYSVKNSAGLSASDFLFIFVEQYSVNVFSYSFSPPNATDLNLVSQLASNLLVSSSMATSLAVQQLPAFGVDSSSIRSVEVNSTSIQAGPMVNGQTSYAVNIQLTVVLVRFWGSSKIVSMIHQSLRPLLLQGFIPETSTPAASRRQLLHQDALPLRTTGINPNNDPNDEGISQVSEKQMLLNAAISAVEAFPYKLAALLSPLDTLIDGFKAFVADSGKPGSESIMKSEDGLQLVEDCDTQPAGRGIGGLAATSLLLLQTTTRSLLQPPQPPQHETTRSLLQQSPLQCGATLSLQNASLASILSASPSVSSCSSAAVSPEAQQMALILGAVDSINQATLDMQVSKTLSLLFGVCGKCHTFND
jgi:hypothetical protein